MLELKEGNMLQYGKYRIVRKLGQGGFGITYEGVQTALDRRVAIKEFFMKSYCTRNEETGCVTVGSEGSAEEVEEYRKKFLKEAQLIARMEDVPNIIRIHDIFEENQTAYYVMEYIAGGSLKQLVAANGALPEQQAKTYIAQVGEALKSLHQRNVLHLDIKPDNILLNQQGTAVLIDFGVSKHYDKGGSQTSSTPIGLSKGYAPTEQYQQGGVDSFSPATDIYSLGATLYFLLTGQAPPDANAVFEDGLPSRPSFISEDVWSTISLAMQPRRKDRIQSVAEFLEKLESSTVKSPVSQQQVTSTPTEPVAIQPKTTPMDSSATVRSKENTEETKLAAKKKTGTRNMEIALATAAVSGILCMLLSIYTLVVKKGGYIYDMLYPFIFVGAFFFMAIFLKLVKPKGYSPSLIVSAIFAVVLPHLMAIIFGWNWKSMFFLDFDNPTPTLLSRILEKPELSRLAYGTAAVCVLIVLTCFAYRMNPREDKTRIWCNSLMLTSVFVFLLGNLIWAYDLHTSYNTIPFLINLYVLFFVFTAIFTGLFYVLNVTTKKEPVKDGWFSRLLTISLVTAACMPIILRLIFIIIPDLCPELV